MKATVLEGVDRPLVIRQVADPVPAPGFARVRLQAAAQFGEIVLTVA